MEINNFCAQHRRILHTEFINKTRKKPLFTPNRTLANLRRRYCFHCMDGDSYRPIISTEPDRDPYNTLNHFFTFASNEPHEKRYENQGETMFLDK